MMSQRTKVPFSLGFYISSVSGYEVRKWAENLRFFYWSPAQSQIYAELRRLSSLDLVSVREVEQQGKPDKRLYKIKERGLDELSRWLNQEEVEPPVLKHSVALRLFSVIWQSQGG